MHIVCTDNYGLTEVMGPGVSGECLAERYQQHIAEDHFLWEVIDPETGEPVGEGEMGELVLTPLCKQGIPRAALPHPRSDRRAHRALRLRPAADCP